MSAPPGAVGFKLVEDATGRWIGPAGPTDAEPVPSPFVAGSGTATDTIFAPAAGAPRPGPGPFTAYFYDDAGTRVGDPVPLALHAPRRLTLVLIGEVISSLLAPDPPDRPPVAGPAIGPVPAKPVLSKPAPVPTKPVPKPVPKPAPKPAPKKKP